MPKPKQGRSSFRSILAPVDFSKHAAAALRYAAGIANRSGGRLTVLFVNDPLLSTAAVASFGADAAKRSEDELRRFVRRALKSNASGIRAARIIVSTGKPAREIVNVARRRGCDLIVMGTHGLGGAARLFFGSTTQGVLQLTAVPVLAIPPAARRAKRSLTRKLAGIAQARDRIEIEAIERLLPAPKRSRPTKKD